MKEIKKGSQKGKWAIEFGYREYSEKDVSTYESNGKRYIKVGRIGYDTTSYYLMGKGKLGKLLEELQKGNRSKPTVATGNIKTKQKVLNKTKTFEVNGRKYQWAINEAGQLIWRGNGSFKNYTERRDFYKQYEAELNSHSKKPSKKKESNNTPVATEETALGYSEVKQYITNLCKDNYPLATELGVFLLLELKRHNR